MKSTFCIVFFSILFSQGFAQLVPVRNDSSLITKNKVEKSSTNYNHEGNDYVIQELMYNQEGRLVSEYLLSLWDVVSYSYTTTFQFDEDGKLIEVLKIQKILNLFPRDNDYIESFGDSPINERVNLFYNDQGELEKKEIFAFHTSALENDNNPTKIITYKYNDGKIVLEESLSEEDQIFNQSYSISYDYDSAQNLIRKIRRYGKELKLTRETRFTYNTQGYPIKKMVIDKTAPHNNVDEKYDYDANGRLIKLYLYSDEEKDYELETTYQYDMHGQRISGDREVQFQYLENGLIKSESWIDDRTEKKIEFITEYEYYQ